MAAVSNQSPWAAIQSVAFDVELATSAPAAFRAWLASSACWPWTRCAAKPSDERDDRPEDEPALARIGPDRAQRDAQPAACAHARDVPDQIAVACAGVGPGEVEPAQARVDRTAPRAGEDVDARAGGLEQQRVGQAGAAGLGLVALGPLGFEPADDLVMAVGRRLRRPQRVAAGVGGLIEQRPIVDPARLPIESGIGGAGQRDRRLGAVGGVHPRHHDPRERAGRSGELLDRLGEPHQREGLAGAGRTDDRGQERSLDLSRHAELRQRLNDPPGLEQVRALGGVGQEDRPDRSFCRRRGGVGGRIGGHGCGQWRRPRRRAVADEADSGCLADFRHAYLLNPLRVLRLLPKRLTLSPPRSYRRRDAPSQE